MSVLYFSEVVGVVAAAAAAGAPVVVIVVVFIGCYCYSLWYEDLISIELMAVLYLYVCERI